MRLSYSSPLGFDISAGVGHTSRVPEPQERFIGLRRMGSDWVGNPALSPSRNTGVEETASVTGTDSGTEDPLSVTFTCPVYVDGFRPAGLTLTAITPGAPLVTGVTESQLPPPLVVAAAVNDAGFPFSVFSRSNRVAGFDPPV